MADFEPSRATVTIVGNVGQVQSKFDGTLAEVTVAVGKGYKDKNTQSWIDTGTDWYTVIARGEWTGVLLGLAPGDRVKIENAKLEHREYPKQDGTTGISYELNFGTVLVLERKADRQPVGAGAASSGANGF